MLSRRAIPLLLAIMLIAGCIYDPYDPPSTVEPHFPENLSQPDSVIDGLVYCYWGRDARRYGTLLAPEFTFVSDTYAGEDTLRREDDLASTRELFESNAVKSVTPDFTWYPATEDSTGIATSHIRFAVFSVFLRNGRGFTFAGEHRIYMRRGDPKGHEDPGRWYITRWREVVSEYSFPEGWLPWGQLKHLDGDRWPDPILSP